MRLLLIIPLLSSFLFGSSQSAEQLEFNKEFNNSLYIIRECYYFLENNKADDITFYSNKKTLKTISGTGNINQDVNLRKVITGFIKLDAVITRIQIDNKIIDVSNSNLRSDLNKYVMEFNREHITFCSSIQNVQHDHSPVYRFSNRLEKHYITIPIAEVCAKIFVREEHRSVRMMVRRTIFCYWKNRNVTAHFKTLMRSSFRYFSSFYIYDKNTDYTYSTTLFSRSRVPVL